MRTPRAAFLRLAALAALLAAGCGSSSSPSSSPAAGPASSTAAGSPPAAVAVAAKSVGTLGTVLVAGPNQLTVYLFEADKGAASSCTGACASAWPPVLGNPKPSGAAEAADLGTIKRADGSTQVTYKGHPLYFFAGDKAAGDARGQGANAFGARWYVLAPSGTPTTSASGASSGGSTTSSGGAPVYSGY